ncbi:MAG: translocation/assembly module TamB, partial [Pseudomonadota bacterium]
MRYYLSGILVFAATLFANAFFVSTPAIAQDSEAEEKGRLVRFVEEQISSPNMQISLNGLAGALSSDVSLSSITIADENGIWLTLTNPRLVWSRSALLRGRLEVESLTAAELEVTRTPAADESLPDAEASGFSIPELPVAVQVQQLQLDRAFFGEAVFGLEATLSLNGRFALADGNLDTELAIERLDGPGGSLGLLAKYNAAEAELETDITLSEPAGGVLANLLSIHDQPAIALSISGGGPVEDLQLNLGLDADNARVLDGRLELDDGFLSSDIGGNFELEGALSTLLAPDQRAFFGDNSRIAVQFEVPSDGGFVVEQLTLDSGAMSANGRIIRQADGFISLVDLTANLALPDGMPVVLPGQAPSPSLSDAALTLQFDAAQSDRWTTQLQVRDLRTQQAIVPALTLNGGGVVSAADANAGRTVTFDVDASAQGIDAAEAELQDALGDA